MAKKNIIETIINTIARFYLLNKVPKLFPDEVLKAPYFGKGHDPESIITAEINQKKLDEASALVSRFRQDTQLLEELFTYVLTPGEAKTIGRQKAGFYLNTLIGIECPGDAPINLKPIYKLHYHKHRE